MLLFLACTAVVELGADAGGLDLDLTCDFANTEVATNTDLAFDASGVTRDWVCDPLEGPITELVLYALPELDHATAERRLCENSLSQADVSEYYTLNPADGDRPFSSLTGPFGASGALATTTGSWVLTARSEDAFAGVQFVSPSLDSTVDTVVVADPCGSVDLDVDLGEGISRALPGDRHLSLDWSALTQDLEGHNVDPVDLVDLTVGRFTAAELGTGLLRDDLGADETWSMTTSTPPTADLDQLTGDAPFRGFESGTWAITLRPEDDTALLPAWIEIFGVP